MPPFPSLKAKRLLWILLSEPIGYRIVRQRGSHRILEAPGRKRIVFAFHDGQTVPPGVVRRMLEKEAGLDANAALDLL